LACAARRIGGSLAAGPPGMLPDNGSLTLSVCLMLANGPQDSADVGKCQAMAASPVVRGAPDG